MRIPAATSKMEEVILVFVPTIPAATTATATIVIE
jgi:hypothetical protein